MMFLQISAKTNLSHTPYFYLKLTFRLVYKPNNTKIKKKTGDSYIINIFTKGCVFQINKNNPFWLSLLLMLGK